MHVPQAHTILAVLACLAVQTSLSVAEQPPSLEPSGLWQAANRSAPSSQPLAPQRPCRIPVYMNLRVINDGTRIHMQWESRYLLQVVLAGIPSTCGCTMQLHDRHGDTNGNNTSVQAIQQLPGLDAPALVVVIQGGPTSEIEEAEAIHEVKDVARQKLIVIHLGDERTDIPHDASWYPHVKAVFRNYHRHSNTSALSPLQSWMQYLLPTPEPAIPDTELGTADTELGTANTQLGTADTELGTADTESATSDTETDSALDQGSTRKMTSTVRNQRRQPRGLQQVSVSKDHPSLGRRQARNVRAHRALRRFQPHMWQQGNEDKVTTEDQDDAQVMGPLPLEDVDGVTPEDDVYQGSNVFWFPLGYGEYFVPSPALQSPFSERPLLWAWAGSEGGKVERQHMLKYFSQPPLSELGELHVIQVFRSLRMMGAAQYTSMLYAAKLVPLPKGVHPEQYRLWEALAAGAIPIAKINHATTGLAHIALLGFKLLWIEEWPDAPKLLLEILQDQQLQAELSEWQQHNLQVYEHVMSRVSDQVAQAVCA